MKSKKVVYMTVIIELNPFIESCLFWAGSLNVIVKCFHKFIFFNLIKMLGHF